MIRLGKTTIRANWGALAFATLILAVSLWYYLSAQAVSDKYYNLILITPCVAAITLLYIATLLAEVKVARADTDIASENKVEFPFPKMTSNELRILSNMVLVCVYVAVLESIGFDIASFVFIGLNLLLLGERRFLHIIVFALLFSGLSTWAVVAVSSFTIPTMLI